MKNVLIFCGIMYRVYRYQTLDDGLDRLIKKGAVKNGKGIYNGTY